jgi:hypothetical protein
MIQSNNLIYLTYSNKPRCIAITGNKHQCKNSANHKCNLTGKNIYCGIHKKQLNKQTFNYKLEPIKINTCVKHRITDSNTIKGVIKIQSIWRMYKERIYKLVFNNGINSSNDISILTLDPIRELKDAFIFYITINGCKRWYMESLKNMYNWYLIYKKKQSSAIIKNNIKCVYTNKEMTDDEQEYIVNVFKKIKKINKYISVSIFENEKKTLYESVFDNCYNIFTDSTESTYIDVFMKLPLDSVYRLIIESNKIMIDNNIYNVLKSCRRIIDKIKYNKHTSDTLYSLYKQGAFKLRYTPDKVTILHFIKNRHIIDQEYKTLLIKDYFINELIDKCDTNDMLMYYIKANNIWYYSITNVFLPDLPKNDDIVNNFGQLSNMLYIDSFIK